MAYLYKNLCYADKSSVYAAMAANCDSNTSDGSGLSCTSTDTGYVIYKTNSAGTSSLSVNPASLELCVPQFDDAITLSWACVAVIAAAWCVSILRKPIR